MTSRLQQIEARAKGYVPNDWADDWMIDAVRWLVENVHALEDEAAKANVLIGILRHSSITQDCDPDYGPYVDYKKARQERIKT